MRTDILSNLSIGPMGILIIGIVIIVVLILKGMALWHAAKRNEPWWFVILLIVNTVGILELIYLIFVAKIWPKIYS